MNAPPVIAVETSRTRMAERLRAVLPKAPKTVLLIQPLQIPDEKIDVAMAARKRYYCYPPYAIGLLKADLGRRGYDVRLIDLNQHVLAALQDVDPATTGPDQIRDLWQAELRRGLAGLPDLVGISCMFTMTHEVIGRMARFIRAEAPGVAVVAGGVHVTNAPEIVLNEIPEIDALFLHECDTVFGETLDFLSGRAEAQVLRQVATRDEDGGVMLLDERHAPEGAILDSAPDFDALPLGDYSAAGESGVFRFWRPAGARASASLMHRGCRARCTFCSVRHFNGPGVRGRSVGAVVDEIERLRDERGVTHLTWLDDDLFYEPDKTLAVFQELARRDLGVTWDASNGIIASAAAAHPELVEAAAASGCIGMYFGIESGNAEILARIRKPSGLKHYLRVGELMAGHPGIFTRGFLIIGFPGETLGQMRDTVRLARDMALDWYTVQLLTPLPSTEIYHEMVEAGLIAAGSLNTEGEGYTMFSVREGERQRRRETAGTASGLLDALDPAWVPGPADMSALWLMIDFEVNYARVTDQRDPARLRKLKAFLTDVCDRMTLDNPLPNLFLGLVEERLGDPVRAETRRQAARAFHDASPYWRTWFERLEVSV